MPTSSGFLYLAVVLDAWSRKIVGWSMANHLRTELVLDALEMAVGQRRPRNVIHHSDQGSQYTSWPLAAAAVKPACGLRWAELAKVPPAQQVECQRRSVGDAYDCESMGAARRA